LKNLAAQGAGSLYAMLSPMMACEEAYLLGQWIRSLDPQALLVLGPVPTSGQPNEVFRNSLNGKQTFEIQAEKVPNAAGVRRVMSQLGGPQATFADLVEQRREDVQTLRGGWIVGGYLSDWVGSALPGLLQRGGSFRVVQDILPNALTESADVLIPAAAWAEKDGTWENYAGRLQTFSAAIVPPEGARREGDVYLALLGRTGLYNAAQIRQEMGEPFAGLTVPTKAKDEPAFEFAEL
jgi:hypothetical protein